MMTQNYHADRPRRLNESAKHVSSIAFDLNRYRGMQGQGTVARETSRNLAPVTAFHRKAGQSRQSSISDHYGEEVI